MKKSSTSKRLKEYMTKYGLKQVDILRKIKPFSEKFQIKFNKSDLSQYVAGKTEPRQDKIFLLARGLGVSDAWIMGYDVEDDLDAVKIPLLGQIACGSPILADENIEDYIPVPANVKVDFALRAKGDSMINARIHDGDVVMIQRADIVDNGHIAAVAVGDEVTLKRVYYYPEKDFLELRPENPSYESLIFTGQELEQVRIIGLAVAFTSLVR